MVEAWESLMPAATGPASAGEGATGLRGHRVVILALGLSGIDADAEPDPAGDRLGGGADGSITGSSIGGGKTGPGLLREGYCDSLELRSKTTASRLGYAGMSMSAAHPFGSRIVTIEVGPSGPT